MIEQIWLGKSLLGRFANLGPKHSSGLHEKMITPVGKRERACTKTCRDLIGNLATYMLLVVLICIRPEIAGAATPNPLVDMPILASTLSYTNLHDPSWDAAASISLGYDFNYRRVAEEPTTVKIAEDRDALDIGFIVEQRGALVAAQGTNGSAVISDDYVGVYLWPQGTQGFAYAFFANPRGARYQTSSENSAYSPDWDSEGEPIKGGYSVIMRIPLNVIRSGGSRTWRAQFVRATVSTGAIDVWTYSPNSQTLNDPTSAGVLDHLGTAAGPARASPRAQIYVLGEGTTATNGGSTSRVGGDLSLPITATSSFVASLHPDYSNVELDQQTIAPSAFAYQYSEVRPFFTQLGQAFNITLNCTNCPQMLYTPAIPIFREGYAVEGTQGPFTFAGFDAIGDGRADQANAITYAVQDSEHIYGASFQRVSVDTSTGIHDNVTSFGAGYEWVPQHVGIFSNGGFDRGSNVTRARSGNYEQDGVYYATAAESISAQFTSIGAQYDPVDGYVAQSDIAGPSVAASRILNFSPTANLHDISASLYYGSFSAQSGASAQHDLQGTLNFDFRNLTTVRFAGGEQRVRAADGEFLPFDVNTIELGYKVATVTPTYVILGTGQFYHGRLNTRNYFTTQPLRKRINLTLQVEENDYQPHLNSEPRAKQYLDRLSLDYQISKDASLDLGVRRILGITTPDAIALPTFASIDANNVTFAFHLLKGRNEFYFVYGDANSLFTTPAIYFKWIRYIGAGKGV